MIRNQIAMLQILRNRLFFRLRQARRQMAPAVTLQTGHGPMPCMRTVPSADLSTFDEV